MSTAGPGGTPLLCLLLGPETLLADREATHLRDAVRQAEPEAEVVDVRPEGYEPGALGVHAGPSLFGGWTLLVVHDLDEADDALVDDVRALATDLPEDVTLVVRHKGGNRGKRALDALRGAGARVVDCKAIRSEKDKVEFVRGEFQAARRRVAPEAALALVQAVGRDVRELASACAQLVQDTTGVVGIEQVHTYYGDRVETTAFKVAEAALKGEEAEALRLLRHAFAGGLDPVPLVAVLALQLRQVGRVASAGRVSAASLARDLGMAPWQVDQARRTAQGWDGPRLGRAIRAVAEADVEVKGGLRTGPAARDPQWAVERAVLAICRERQGGAP